jgi:hypothetical protein
MRARLLLSVAAATLVVGLIPAPAGAVDVTSLDGTVSADLSSSGTRSITAVTPIVTASSLNALATTTYGVTVVELARTGTANWTVSAKLCGQTAVGNAVKDCTNHNNALTSATSGVELPGSAVSLSNRAVSELGTTAGTVSAGVSGTATLGSAASLFTAAESVGTLYTETFSSSGNVSISPPAGQAAETYVGYFVVDLV